MLCLYGKTNEVVMLYYCYISWIVSMVKNWSSLAIIIVIINIIILVDLFVSMLKRCKSFRAVYYHIS